MEMTAFEGIETGIWFERQPGCNKSQVGRKCGGSVTPLIEFGSVYGALFHKNQLIEARRGNGRTETS